MAGYTADATDAIGASAIETDSSSSVSAQALMTPEGDTDLPTEVAYLPTAKPGAEFAVLAPAGAQAIAGHTPQSLEPGAQASTEVAEAAPQADPQESKLQPAAENSLYVTADETPAAEAPAPKKKGFFASLFGSSPAQAKPAPIIVVNTPAAKPVITLASAESADMPLIDNSVEIQHASMNGALPGVRQSALFEIKRKSGLDDDSDVDINEDEGPGLYQVASAAGMARLAPNGLLKQTEGVDVACLKPSLVRVLKTIESHYGKKMIVTSGFRDPSRNRRANGARNSLHMYCAAADIQIPGVSKWELANYARTMAGRGGVGTYCHTESVHVDVGPERDWNWRCRRHK